MASSNGVSKLVRRRTMKRFKYTCQRCGIVGREQRHVSRAGNVCHTYPTSEPGVFLSIDHKKARINGGSSHPRNLQVLCCPCNRSKGTS